MLIEENQFYLDWQYNQNDNRGEAQSEDLEAPKEVHVEFLISTSTTTGTRQIALSRDKDGIKSALSVPRRVVNH
jgi:hypothetical protein